MANPIKAARAYVKETERHNRIINEENAVSLSMYGGTSICLSALIRAFHWRRMERGLLEQLEILSQIEGGVCDELSLAKLSLAKQVAEIPIQPSSPRD